MKPISNIQLVGAALLALLAWHKLGGGLPFPAPDSSPEEAMEAPAEPLRSSVAPVTQILKSATGRKTASADLARFYRAMALVTERGGCQTTGQARSVHSKAAEYTFYGELRGKIPGLKEAVEKVLTDNLGLEDTALSPEIRAKLVAVWKALAWACQEAS